MLDASTVLLTRHGAHLRAYLAPGHVVLTTLGRATVVYMTDDGYLGCHVEGDDERRIEEIPAELRGCRRRVVIGFTRDNISFEIVRTFRDCAEELGNEEHTWYGDRALNQFLDYRLHCAAGADTDALDHVCKLLNTEPPRVESYPGRRDWKHAVLESI